MSPELVLAEAWPVVLDEVQYARAEAHALGGRLGPTQFAAVIFTRDRFRPAKDCEDQAGAEVAFMMLVIGIDGETADVVAWLPESGKFATLLGAVGTLGLSVLRIARLEPPVVHESLSAWLLAEETGLFILDPQLAAAELDGVTIASPDKIAAIRLRNRLAPYCARAPKIVIPRSNASRAG